MLRGTMTRPTNELLSHSRTIYIGNLPINVTEPQLIDLFKSCGSIKFVRVTAEGGTTSR